MDQERSADMVTSLKFLFFCFSSLKTSVDRSTMLHASRKNTLLDVYKTLMKKMDMMENLMKKKMDAMEKRFAEMENKPETQLAVAEKLVSEMQKPSKVCFQREQTVVPGETAKPDELEDEDPPKPFDPLLRFSDDFGLPNFPAQTQDSTSSPNIEDVLRDLGNDDIQPQDFDGDGYEDDGLQSQEPSKKKPKIDNTKF